MEPILGILYTVLLYTSLISFSDPDAYDATCWLSSIVRDDPFDPNKFSTEMRWAWGDDSNGVSHLVKVTSNSNQIYVT